MLLWLLSGIVWQWLGVADLFPWLPGLNEIIGL